MTQHGTKVETKVSRDGFDLGREHQTDLVVISGQVSDASAVDGFGVDELRLVVEKLCRRRRRVVGKSDEANDAG